MSRLTSEPTSIQSMDELLAVALAMEKESANRYAALAERMRSAGRLELAGVFDGLVREEARHIDMVVSWSRHASHQPRDIRPADAVPQDVFDDETIGLVSPELVDAYRSFAIAVRNEERAFAFWSYIAAHGASPEIREAAEQMAREELEHAKTLRRERRKAFFKDRRLGPAVREHHDLPSLEMEVCQRLEDHAGSNENRSEYADLALEARMLSLELASDPLQDAPHTGPPPPKSLDALCEWLADYYIDAGEHLPSQTARDRAQALATIAVKRLAVVRALAMK
ncbi:ferritin family protein [Mesorhizobium qingshengii]|uniref:Ferritin family protein n=1 Tax=Mesorhizobium qingshengii TaxID=1165689 RepID=A0ABT4R2F4_9HYPH|nr:ferritin family protein [Mesorhizobium qingshengii]MCZ8548021.1 ferritin family protein [Mesorhizobium qingshengii]